MGRSATEINLKALEDAQASSAKKRGEAPDEELDAGASIEERAAVQEDKLKKSNVDTAEKQAAEEGRTSTGATSKAPAVATLGEGKGKGGGYGKSSLGKGPEAWPVPIKPTNSVQKEYIQDVLEDTPVNAARVLGHLEDTEENFEQTLAESNIEESDQMSTGEIVAVATEYFVMTPGDRGELENEEDSEGTNNTKDKERSSRWKRNPREEEK
jgi:hypothetical protein